MSDTLVPYTTLFRSALRDTPRGTLRVVLPVSYGKNWVMPLLNSFAKRYPDLTITVTLSDRLDELAEDSFDVALAVGDPPEGRLRSEEHTSELQSLMRISYAVFCLKKTITIKQI